MRASHGLSMHMDKPGLPWLYGAVYEALPWFMELYMRLIMAYRAVYEAYHGLWCYI